MPKHIYKCLILGASYKLEPVFIKSLKLYKLIMEFLTFSIECDLIEYSINSQQIDKKKIEFVSKLAQNVIESSKLYIEEFKLLRDAFDSKILLYLELDKIYCELYSICRQNTVKFNWNPVYDLNESFETDFENFKKNYKLCKGFFVSMVIGLSDFEDRELLFLNHSHNCEDQLDDDMLNPNEKDEFEMQEENCNRDDDMLKTNEKDDFEMQEDKWKQYSEFQLYNRTSRPSIAQSMNENTF